MEKSQEITESQRKVLKVIKQYIKSNGFAPTVRELAELLELKSISTVQCHLDRLERKGYIHRNRLMPRTIVVYDKKS